MPNDQQFRSRTYLLGALFFVLVGFISNPAKALVTQNKLESPGPAVRPESPGEKSVPKSGRAKSSPKVHRDFVELAAIHYRDPDQAKELWLGLEGSGIYLPAAISPADRTIAMGRGALSWAFGVLPGLAFGGRHEVAGYQAKGNRLQVHSNDGWVSLAPLKKWSKRFRVDDRLEFAVGVHRLVRILVLSDGEWEEFGVGGIRDAYLALGYGMHHQLSKRWWLGWNVQGRHAWVFQSTQRIARAGLRAAFVPRDGHRLSLNVTGFFVHRDEKQFGSAEFERRSFHGQVESEYQWMSPRGFGFFLRPRYMTSFFSGEIPMYEVRTEALQIPFADLSLGFLLRW